MTYSNLTIDNLITTLCRTESESARAKGFSNLSPAGMFLLGEMILKVREKCIEWFKLIEAGKDEFRLSDPLNNEWTLSRANKLIKELEEDFLLEKGRWSNEEIDAGPGFDRLKPQQRIAFCQDLGTVLKSDEELEKEAIKLVKLKKKIVVGSVWVSTFKSRGFCGQLCRTPTPIPWYRKETHGRHTKPASYYLDDMAINSFFPESPENDYAS